VKGLESRCLNKTEIRIGDDWRGLRYEGLTHKEPSLDGHIEDEFVRETSGLVHIANVLSQGRAPL